MSNLSTSRPVKMDFMRLLFTDPVEEALAHRWACRFAALVGPAALRLRPETTLGEMLEWAARAKVDSMDFVFVFEPELRMDFAQFLDDANHVTFREMVKHYAERFGSYVAPSSGSQVAAPKL